MGEVEMGHGRACVLFAALALTTGCSAAEGAGDRPTTERSTADPQASAAPGGPPTTTPAAAIEGGSSPGLGGGPTAQPSPPTPSVPPAPVTPPAPPAGPGEEVDVDLCPGPITAAQLTALEAGGPVPAEMQWLYPYDQTVFPLGLPAPELQWAPASADSEAVLVEVTSASVRYRACLEATPLSRVRLDQTLWEQAFAASLGGDDPLRIEVTTLAGGVARGPIGAELILTRASLKGAIYYNTYNSAIAAREGIGGGVVMRVIPGAEEPEVFVRAQSLGAACVGCHSVSADGTRMVVEEHSNGGLTYGTSLSYALAPGQATMPPANSQLGNSKAAFSALYPDGSRFLTTGRPELGPFSGGGNVTGTFGIEPAALWETDTGQPIPNTGIPAFAKMPMFNGAGDKVVFTDHEADDALAMMDFDPMANRFSNRVTLAKDPRYIGWPGFLPDDSGVVFSLSTAVGYVAMAGNDLTGTAPNPGNLMLVDLAGGDVIPLARAMGYRDQAMTDPYVPRGERDLNKDYLPTVSPVAAGGYFWLFFSSKRSYGNVKNAAVPAADSKQIWVSALSIPGTDPAFDLSQGRDPSHPPFRLPGQELESGNVRAFAALNPCRSDGEACENGIDCCSGYCTDGICGLPPEEPPRCSEIDEACTTAADCCPIEGVTIECIAGFCAYLQVVK